MNALNCPDCGSPVAPGAAVCAQCGFPLRKDALPRTAGGGPDVSTLFGWGVAAVGVGLLAVFALSMLSRVELPGWAMTNRRAMEREGEALLDSAWVAETAYFADHHAYATSLAELQTVGWAPPRGPSYWLSIVRADSGHVWLQANPRFRARVRYMRIGATGRVERGLTCGQGAAGDEETAWEALELLGDVSAGIDRWKDANGGHLPSTPAEMEEAYAHLGEDPDFRMGPSPAAPHGSFCIFVAPRTPASAPVLFSLDGDATVHRGDGCTGERVRRYGIDLPTTP